MTKSFLSSFITMAILAPVSVAQLNAEEINGTVHSATPEYATVTTESELVPAPGDKAEIFFKLPGADTEISVATGHVYEITGPNIMVEIEKATGQVAKDQLVRIHSPNPKKQRERSSAAPTSTATAPPRAASTPKPEVASARGSSPAAKSFAGRWKVQNENASYTLALTQQGDRVTGNYDLEGGSLEGIVRNGTLVATWRQSHNRRGGPARLSLSKDGETLSGPWEYDPTIYSSGLTGRGTWVFQRESRSH